MKRFQKRVGAGGRAVVSRRRGWRRDQRGSGSLLVLAAVAVLVLAGAAAVLWTAVSAGRHRVAAAADLSALSAAQALQAGDPDPCRAAVRIALSHRADVASCQVDRETVEVVAAVRLDFGSLGQPTIKATARAGPLDPN